MPIPELIQNIKEVILAPGKFWERVKQPETGQNLLVHYYLPLVLAASVAVFIGAWFGSTTFYVRFAIIKALSELVVFLLQYFVSVFLVNELIPTFGGKKDKLNAQKLVVYSLTPFLLVSILTGLFPALYVMDVLGLYSIFIFWAGVKELLGLPYKKESGYVFSTALLNLFTFAFLSIFLWKLFVSFV